MISKIFPRYILGLRTAALFETITFLGCVSLLDYFFGDGTRYIEYSPHPFSIIILLVAVQYGTAEAIVSTLLSTMCLYAWNIPDQHIQESLFDYQFRLVITPLLWFVAAFFIGELRMRLEYKYLETEDELHEVKKHAQVISREYEDLKETKENFEAYLVSQYNTVTNTYKSLKALEVLNPAQILLNLEKVVEGALNIEKFSVFAMGENGLEVVTEHGWNENDPYSLRIKDDNPLFWEIYGEHRIVCVVNEDDEKILNREGLLAGPLIDRDTKELLGMLKIEKMRYMDLNISSIETFRSLCELIGIAYSNARDYVKVKNSSIYEQTTPKLYSKTLFEIQKESFKLLCQQQNKPLYAMSITCADKLDEDSEEKMLGQLAYIVQQLITPPAAYYAGKRKDKTLFLILPMMTKQAAEALSQKILESIIEEPYLNKRLFRFKIEAVTEPHEGEGTIKNE